MGKTDSWKSVNHQLVKIDEIYIDSLLHTKNTKVKMKITLYKKWNFNL